MGSNKAIIRLRGIIWSKTVLRKVAQVFVKSQNLPIKLWRYTAGSKIILHPLIDIR